MIDANIKNIDLQQNKIKESSRKLNAVAKQKNKNFEDELKTQIIDSKTSKPVDKKLMDACVEMESLFVKQMFNTMRKTVEKGPMLHGGDAEEIFEDMLYDEYCLDVSKKSNLGIATMLYEQMSNYI